LAREPTAASSCGAGDKYSWVDIGSSYLPVKSMPHFYGRSWNQPPPSLKENRHLAAIPPGICSLEAQGKVRRPIIQMHVSIMLIYTICSCPTDARNALIEKLKACGINAVFHYVPLHLSPAGRKYGKHGGFY